MIYAVVDLWQKSIIYLVKNNLHNACAERDMLNRIYPMLNQPFGVVSGKKSILDFCGISEKEFKKIKVHQ